MAAFEHYMQIGQKRLRCGYTTGTCAAAAARGAAELLLGGELPGALRIETPSGITVEVEPVRPAQGKGWASCAIRKDGGDDPDVTNGALVYARVELLDDAQIVIDGGKGIGRVTRPGLQQPVGQAAINTVPYKMVTEQALEAIKAHSHTGGLTIIISVPDGERIAAKTFNPRLGIEGGISILGTSGIVRPMSQTAIADTMRVELDIHLAAGRKDILVTPGNYGDSFTKGELALSTQALTLCGNYIGACIDYAASLEFSSLLLIGHLGKLIKVACGNMDTHSRTSDGRRETLAAHTALCGGCRELIHAVFNCKTTDEAIPLLEKEHIREPVMASIASALEENLKRRAGDALTTEAVFFSNQYGVLGKTSGADRLLALHRKGKENLLP